MPAHGREILARPTPQIRPTVHEIIARPAFRVHVVAADDFGWQSVRRRGIPVPRRGSNLPYVSRTISLAVIPGDGIGPDVVAEGLKVLDAVLPGDVKISTTRYDLGAQRWHAAGELLPDTVLEEIRGQDAIFFGAIGDPSVPSGLLERGILLRMRFELDQYVNLRPCRLFPGVTSPLREPGSIDFVVVREGTEGPYVGNGGAMRAGTPHEIATEVSINTARGVQRLVREAFTRAARRPRHKLTLVHKHNVLLHAGGLWRRTVDQLAAEFPAVDVDYLHVDAATIFLVTEPSRFDVIVTDNLFGDILTDLAGAVTGGVGLAASGNINPDRDVPSMFEPVHGSAPDIAGRGIADPTAAVLSAALMLEHLGLPEPAERIVRAVEADLAARGGAVRGTARIGDALADLAAARTGSAR
jgi:3-isopropylmalate dehydrogenase